ncbi:MAG: hypothetical protein IPF58_17430 [Saprospirales bacterium]|nr:hypothetical protein [Saprospirales bacterium]
MKAPLGVVAKKYMDKVELVPDEVTVGMLSNKLDEYAGKVEGLYLMVPSHTTTRKTYG